jgi:hypothetical protein
VFTYLADGPNEWIKRYGLTDTLMKVIGKRTRGYEDALKAFILTLYQERYLNFDLLDNQGVELVSRSGLQIGPWYSK